MHYRKLAAAVSVALALAGPAFAHSYTAGSLKVAHPWSRATAPNQSVGGGFMTITNEGRQADRLLSASTTAAEKVEIHTVAMQGGIMRMRPLPDGLALPARSRVDLKPGGYHIMLVGLKQPLREGARIPLTLRFQRAGEVRVDLAVHAAGYEPGGEHNHGG